MYDKDNTKILKKDFQDWLGTMCFSHYLVIDLPLNRKHYEFDQATEFFKIVIKRFEKNWLVVIGIKNRFILLLLLKKANFIFIIGIFCCGLFNIPTKNYKLPWTKH